jgi:archaellum component FlaC
MDSSLGSVSSKLKKMPEQIEKFSNSIDSLNFITNKQSEKFEENTHKLNATIKSLSNSVNEYEKNINNYSSKLESIVKLTNQQLEIWKEQQRVLLDEFSRKPILKLELKEYSSKKDTSYITDFILKNSGNIESSIRAIFIAIPSDMILTFKSESFIKYKTLDNSVTYRFEPSGTNVEIVSAGSSTILPCVMKLLRKKVVEGIAYRIDYYSKYDSGNKNDNIIFK